MAKDHYVAQTYLKHFVGSTGMLRAYRKSDDSSFPCKPKNICREPYGDIIPDFLSDPGYLGEFRSTFEPLWNSGLDAIKGRRPDMSVKLHIAGYWANLLVCTPAWKRVAVEIHNNNVMHRLRCYSELSVENGKLDGKLEEAVAALNRGEFRLETEPDYVRAQAVRSIMKHAWALYNAEWHVFENDTDIEYVTSDNPAAFVDQGDTWHLGKPFVRLLPLTPRLCLMCDLTLKPQYIKIEPDFTKEPDGKVKGGLVSPKTVDFVNSCVAKCAEEIVIASSERDYVRNLTVKYSRFRVENESAKFRQSNGFLIANRTRVIERIAM